MERLVNLQVLGHPVNWLILILLIVLLWFGAFAVLKNPLVASVLPADKDD